MKTVGGLRKTRHRGRGLVEWFFVLTATAYNLVRIPKLLAATDEFVRSAEYERQIDQIPRSQRNTRRTQLLVPCPIIKKSGITTQFFRSLLVAEFVPA